MSKNMNQPQYTTNNNTTIQKLETPQKLQHTKKQSMLSEDVQKLVNILQDSQSNAYSTVKKQKSITNVNNYLSVQCNDQHKQKSYQKQLENQITYQQKIESSKIKLLYHKQYNNKPQSKDQQTSIFQYVPKKQSQRNETVKYHQKLLQRQNVSGSGLRTSKRVDRDRNQRSQEIVPELRRRKLADRASEETSRRNEKSMFTPGERKCMNNCNKKYDGKISNIFDNTTETYRPKKGTNCVVNYKQKEQSEFMKNLTQYSFVSQSNQEKRAPDFIKMQVDKSRIKK